MGWLKCDIDFHPMQIGSIDGCKRQVWFGPETRRSRHHTGEVRQDKNLGVLME